MANVLVIDDEVGIRELFSEILSDEGYSVTLAANSAEARRAVKICNPDAILLDIWMTDTDGISLLKEWASQGPLPCPIVMMSGHANIDMAVEATKFGAFTFLEKPTSIKTLIDTLHSALAARQTSALLGSNQYATPAKKSPETNAEATKDDVLSSQIDFSLPLREARDQFERAYFLNLLEQESYSMTKVAAKAQLERTHLYRKLRQLGIDWSKDDTH